ncbi:MAG: P-loop NTPase [Candidatus Aminicenantes bacterium]|nr:P-loop NTPase [Candidatus Aminicenantes bacterium]
METSLWAIGSGKGGTGKSFVAANLGVSLAARGRDVLLVDTDLGAPNLHTLLGVREAPVDMSDFLTGRVASLQETAVPTAVPNLRLVKGTDELLFIANINYLKKKRLLRQIKALQAAHIVLDTGTGSAFNSLDFFLLGRPGTLVITPDPTAIENGYYFLKSAIIRVLRLYMEFYRMKDLHARLLEQAEKDSRSLYAFFQNLQANDPAYGAILYRALKSFRPGLIVNKARNERDVLLGRAISDVAQKYLLVDLDFLGAIPYDERVESSLRRLSPFVLDHPTSPAASALDAIADRLFERSRVPFKEGEIRTAVP